MGYSYHEWECIDGTVDIVVRCDQCGDSDIEFTNLPKESVAPLLKSLRAEDQKERRDSMIFNISLVFLGFSLGLMLGFIIF